MARAIIAPTRTAPRQSTLLARILYANNAQCPCSKYDMVSKAKLEKVVYDPQKPIATNRRQRGSTNTRSVVQIRKNTRIRLPVTLINNVPKGKAASLKRVIIRLRK